MFLFCSSYSTNSFFVLGGCDHHYLRGIRSTLPWCCNIPRNFMLRRYHLEVSSNQSSTKILASKINRYFVTRRNHWTIRRRKSHNPPIIPLDFAFPLPCLNRASQSKSPPPPRISLPLLNYINQNIVLRSLRRNIPCPRPPNRIIRPPPQIRIVPAKPLLPIGNMPDAHVLEKRQRRRICQTRHGLAQGV